MQPFAEQRVAEAEHQRDIGLRARRPPLRAGFQRGVVADRADRDQFGPLIAAGQDAFAQRVAAEPTG